MGDILSLFQNSLALCVHLGNYEFSLAIEYCLISHESSDREKKTSPKKYIRRYIFMKYIYM